MLITLIFAEFFRHGFTLFVSTAINNCPEFHAPVLSQVNLLPVCRI
jgi:hypothetical protein